MRTLLGAELIEDGIRLAVVGVLGRREVQLLDGGAVLLSCQSGVEAAEIEASTKA